MSRQFLTPVGLPTGSALPSTGETDNLFYLTTDSRVYQHNGTAWVPVTVVPAGGATGEFLAKVDGTDYSTTWTSTAPAAGYTSVVKHEVKLGEAIAKGQAVYVSSADGTNMIVSKASNASEATSSKTIGLLEAGGSTNAKVNVVTEGLLSGLNTGTAAAGDPVWLGTAGDLIYGLVNKPVAPAHLVFIGVVTRANSSTGEIFIKVQNGFELRELHTVLLEADVSIADNEVLAYDSATSLWKNQTSVEANLAQLSGGNSLTGAQTIVSSSTTATGLIVKAIASQTANLQLWQDSTGATLASINASGDISTTKMVAAGGAGWLAGAISVQPINVTSSAIVARALASQTANLQEWQDSAGTRQGYVGPGGNTLVFPGITAAYSLLATTSNTAVVPLTVKAAASQTASMQEWQNSGATVIAGVDAYGNAAFGGWAPSSSYGLRVTTNGNPAVVGVLVKGAASQSANLQEWHTSTGSTLATLSASGVFSAVSKSFLIDHPTKPGKKLRYGSLEGPENGVYVRGTVTDGVIELPDYWTKLVDPETITVSLTPVGRFQKLYVDRVESNRVYVSGPRKMSAHYVVYAERADTARLVVEE